MNRLNIIDRAKQACKEIKKERITSTQIRKYMNVVSSSENFEEYIMFLKYQLRRKKSIAKLLETHLKELRESCSSFEELKPEIGYYFGTIFRLLKIDDDEITEELLGERA